MTWGFAGGTNYAHRTSSVRTGALAIAGTFLRGDQSALAQDSKPAVLLHSGWGNQTNSAYVERPGTAAYADGLANYPGLNFRAPAQGRSFIGATNTPVYPLTPRSKYYTRFGGVSGIHEAAGFPTNLSLHGYPFRFLTYRLSFLDSDNRESRTDGAIALGGPAGFNLEFERMKFLCRGSLDRARLPAATGVKHMAYWNTDIRPYSLSFVGNDPCNLAQRFLVLGVETRLPFLPDAFHAALGFKPNGNLVTKADALLHGVDSRFPVPARLSLRGPGNKPYAIATGSEGYFNNWETPGRPAAGFFNIAGRLQLPFFRDTKIHLHVTPTGQATNELHLMGGWASESGQGLDLGWNVGGGSFFTVEDFDSTHAGWPAGTPLESYRHPTNATYRPRAQQNWIDVALFDYPLKWDPVLRTFSGWTKAPVTLPVFNIDSELKKLTPTKVDLDFAQDLNVDLPVLKVIDLADAAVDELTSPVLTLSNALHSVLGNTFNSVGLTAGIQSLQQLTRQNADDLFRPVLTVALDPAVTNLYNAFTNAFALGKSNLLLVSSGAVGALTNGLPTVLQNLNGVATNANTFFGKLNGALADVTNSLGLFIRVMQKDGAGNRHVIRTIIRTLEEKESPRLGFIADFTDELVNGLLVKIEPTLAELESQLRDLREQVSEFSRQVALGTGDLTTALDAASGDAGALADYLALAGTGMSNLLESAVGPSGDFFSGDPEHARAAIRERLIITFLSSGVPGRYQQTLRQFFTDKDFLLNQILASLFDQINRTIREGLEDKIQGARDGIFQHTRGPGAMRGSLLTAKVKGAPLFNGYSLESIHLTADVKMNLPDEMKFPAFMDIKRLRSSTTEIGCIPPGEPAAEITLGAHNVPLDWASTEPTNNSNMKLSLDARWTLQSGLVKGIGGSLRIGGASGFKGCSMSEITAMLAMGEIDNYFAGQAKATVSIPVGAALIPVDFRAGIFAGEACSLQPLQFIDPEVGTVLGGSTRFNGVYMEYGGGLSLTDILLKESTDFLNVRADITTALFYEGGRTYGRIGGRQKISADVKLFYVLSGHVDWSAMLIADSGPPAKLTLAGAANVCGQIGICPFCARGCAGIGLTGEITTGGIKLKLEY